MAKSAYFSPVKRPVMPKPVFQLLDSKSTKDTAIILYYTCSDARLKYYLGKSVHPDDWDSKAQTAHKKSIRQIIARLVTFIEDTQAQYDGQLKKLTKKQLIEKLDQFLQKTPKVTRSIYEPFEKVIALMREGKILTPKNLPYGAGTVRTIEHAAAILKKFNPTLTFEDISLTTREDFIYFCHQNNFSVNYTGTLIKNWKTLLRITNDKGYHDNLIYDHKDFKKMDEETDDIALDDIELKLLYEKDLSFYPRWEVARDWFMLDCYTGLRVSDLVRLSGINRSKDFITIANEKTDEKVVIPIHPVARAILIKYKGFPPAITDVEINRSIKQVAEYCKLDEVVLYTMTKGGKRQDFYLKKFELISNHTARRSFITNLLTMGVPDAIVMKLTGIKSPNTLKRYNKMTALRAAKKASEHAYFKG